MSFELLPAILANLVTAAPWLTVAIVGIVIAAVRSSAHPQVSKLLIVILVVEIFLTVLSTINNVAMPILLRSNGYSISELGLLMGAVGLCLSFVRALMLALTIWAVLGWRTRETA